MPRLTEGSALDRDTYLILNSFSNAFALQTHPCTHAHTYLYVCMYIYTYIYKTFQYFLISWISPLIYITLSLENNERVIYGFQILKDPWYDLGQEKLIQLWNIYIYTCILSEYHMNVNYPIHTQALFNSRVYHGWYGVFIHFNLMYKSIQCPQNFVWGSQHPPEFTSRNGTYGTVSLSSSQTLYCPRNLTCKNTDRISWNYQGILSVCLSLCVCVCRILGMSSYSVLSTYLYPISSECSHCKLNKYTSRRLCREWELEKIIKGCTQKSGEVVFFWVPYWRFSSVWKWASVVSQCS